MQGYQNCTVKKGLQKGKVKNPLLLLIFITVTLFSSAQRQDSLITLNAETQVISLKNTLRSLIPVSTNIQKENINDLLQANPFLAQLIPPEKVARKLICRFTLYNSRDVTDSFYFFPGFYFSNTILYQLEGTKTIPLPVIAPQHKDSISFRLFYIPANDTIQLLAECYQEKTYNNFFRPVIIPHKYINAYKLEIHNYKSSTTLFTYIFSGLLLMMVLFSLANFFPGKKGEFLLYAIYALMLGFMLFTKQYYYNRSNIRSFFFETYLDFLLQTIGIIFFMAFMIRFLETRKYFPFLHKFYTAGIIFLGAVIITYTYLHYGTTGYYLENLLENYITKGALLVMIIIFLVFALRNWHQKILRYLFWGNLLFFLFGIISLLLIVKIIKIRTPGLLTDSLVLYELGLLTELVFFLLALTYKNRTQLIEQTQERERLKTENERKELEKQVAVMQAHQEERERISADIHDELGSGMTTIRLMSEIAKNKMKENTPAEIEKISSSANEVLNKMNAIIWSMNSSNDTVDNLISYIRVYAFEYFDGTSIECNVKMPAEISPIVISGDKRRNIFLCIKETLNNTLKHSKASKVEIEIVVNNKLRVKIADNGIGIEKIRQFGNGLMNIERRMRTIGGTYSIVNNGGSETRIELPL
jgi:signal transduction histidine kinase